MAIPHKTKIINDPVHGFITISSPLIQTLIEHPYIQRLRNIKQLGLTYLVYPGACHNRFQHGLGAMHLMSQAIETLRGKGHTITEEESDAALAAILLHDIGHGPFSHALEYSIVDNIQHEELSMMLMNKLNVELGGQLELATAIFAGNYHKQFLNDLVSSQLDVDRLDYLRRDSFFSGVVEGMIGLERIIKMMDVAENELVIEAKAIYSIEKFLISRRLMYWQVYLHKTVLSAEQAIVQILRRAKTLARCGVELFASPALSFFLKNQVHAAHFESPLQDGYSPLEHFVDLCDNDIDSALKVWTRHPDRVLSTLCKMMVGRKLFRTELQHTPFDEVKLSDLRSSVQERWTLSADEVDYFVLTGMVSNKAYSSNNHSIKVKYNDGRLMDIFDASDILGANAFSEETYKYLLCYPKTASK